MLTSVPSDTEVILRWNICHHNLVPEQMGHPVIALQRLGFRIYCECIEQVF